MQQEIAFELQRDELDTKLALILIEVLHKKAVINRDTYLNTFRLYKDKLKEVA